MSKKIICYHLNDSNFYLPSKNGDFYPDETRRWWGKVITNKAKRTERDFALLIDPEGRKINTITHATFDLFANSMKHEYIKTVSERELNDFINLIPSLSNFQTHRLVRCLENSPYLEKIEYQPLDFYSYKFLKDQ